ncbi:helix-turn-helix transcriptional regulator [Streptomyces spectabilis]|uniref:helix-turn-helix domain-containing protein n=1 Tax=Streptomyces spectabilis TaxID=68270 RepID=UPI0033FEB9F5
MAQDDMPTVRSRRLGNELRRLRLDAGLKTQDAANALECGQPKISQIENGRRGIRQLDLTTLLNLYGVTDDEQRANMKRLAKEIHRVDWWSGQGPLLHDTLRDYLTLEADSQLSRMYEPVVVPGPLQTEAYMREMFASVESAEKVEQLVETRMKRKELLDDGRSLQLRTIMDVPSLRRIGGGRDVVRGQLEHLLDIGARRNVTIQVLPLDATLPMEQYVPYTIFGLRGAPPVDVIWLEHTTGGTLLEQERDVQRYSKAWDDLTAAAMSPTASQQHIRDLLKELDHDDRAGAPEERP